MPAFQSPIRLSALSNEQLRELITQASEILDARAEENAMVREVTRENLRREEVDPRECPPPGNDDW